MSLFALSLVGGFIALDTTAVLQGLISQPLVAGIVLGWLSGNLVLGMHVGLLMQLLWLNQLPVGAAKIPEGNLASIIAVLLTVRLNILFENSQSILIFSVVLYTLLFSWLGTLLTTFMRSVNIRLFDFAFRALEKERIYALGGIHIAALLIQFVLQAALVYLAVLVGQTALRELLIALPAEWNNAVRYIELAVIGSGVGMTLALYKEKKEVYLLIVGAALGILFIFVM